VTGQKMLLDDAGPYFEHVTYFIRNIRHGIYPFWDPNGLGIPNDFYLRRIGEFNPLFWAITILETAGLHPVTAYRVFLCLYFLSGMTAFYLLCRRFTARREVALAATGLLMFSSLGTLTFQSYLMLTMTPMLWFFYCLTAFAKDARRFHALGATFSAMVLMVTYVPFYFLTILSVISLVWCLFYARQVPELFKRVASFVHLNKWFSFFCAFALACSLIPGILWYKEADKQDAWAPSRHEGSTITNAASVSIKRGNEGGINMADVTGHIFANFDTVRMGEFYIPIWATLLLLMGIWTAYNKRMVFFFVAGGVFYLIGVADASPIYKFLYENVFFFKFFRNLHFFLWLAVIPIFILFLAEEFEKLLTQPLGKKQKIGMTIYTVLLHVSFAIFLIFQEGSIVSTYGSILFSFILFLGLIWGKLNPLGISILAFAAVVIQPLEVYSHTNHFYEFKRSPFNTRDTSKPLLPVMQPRSYSSLGEDEGDYIAPPYFASRWIYPVINKIKGGPFNYHWEKPFILYDNVSPLDDNTVDFNAFKNYTANFLNTAFVPTDQAVQAMALNQPSKSETAKVVTQDSKEIMIVEHDANHITLKTDLASPRFLVRNNSYHPRWNVFLDGKREGLYRANVAAQGVWLPAGKHTVLFRYGSFVQYLRAYFLMLLFALVFIYWIWLGVRKV
jgi:hypothetical protein